MPKAEDVKVIFYIKSGLLMKYKIFVGPRRSRRPPLKEVVSLSLRNKIKAVIRATKSKICFPYMKLSKKGTNLIFYREKCLSQSLSKHSLWPMQCSWSTMDNKYTPSTQWMHIPLLFLSLWKSLGLYMYKAPRVKVCLKHLEWMNMAAKKYLDYLRLSIVNLPT